MAAVIAVVLLGVGSGSSASAADPCGAGGNPISCENSKPGSPPSEWQVGNGADPSIQGFPTQMSVAPGQTISFKIKTDASGYRIDIYRLGYYDGDGARKVATITPSATLPQTQPACLTDSTTGLIDCGNWAVSASWAVPATAVSGVYIAALTRDRHRRHQTRSRSSSANDVSHSDIVFQTSDRPGRHTTTTAATASTRPSLRRAAPTRSATTGPFTRPASTDDLLFGAEYPMLAGWSSNGYDVSYISGVDTDRSGRRAAQPQVFLSSGHDEYWSGAAARQRRGRARRGREPGFFSGNEVFWKTGWEPSIDGTNTPYRTLVCYKETHRRRQDRPAARDLDRHLARPALQPTGRRRPAARTP